MIFKRIVPDEYYLFSSDGYTPAPAVGWLLLIAIAADYVTNVNSGLKQFVTAVGIYSATNPLWPWTTFQ